MSPSLLPCFDCGEAHDEDGECAYEEPNLARCDYYQGVGYCTFGCREEPSCMTDRPSEGWPDPAFTSHELNVLAVRRYSWRLQKSRNWQRTLRIMERTT